MGKTHPAHLRKLLGSSIYIFEGLSGLQILQVAGRHYCCSWNSWARHWDLCICHGRGEKKKTQAMSLPKLKAAQSFQNKRRGGRVHQSFLLTTGRCHWGLQHGRDLSAQPMCFLITLLISRQTKFRSSSIFSLKKIFPTFISCILIAPCGCQLSPAGTVGSLGLWDTG